MKPTKLKPGDEIHVRLYWRAEVPLAESYTVFVHLLSSDNQVRGQRDSIPDRGLRPTYTWMPGEIIVDDVRFAVAPDASPGSYQLEVGMYQSASGVRLPVTGAAGAPLGTRMLLPQPIIVR